MLRFALSTALFALILSAGTANAQTGQIRGKIIDKTSQHPLPGANIRLLETQLGAMSAADGSFFIDQVPEDIYKLQISFIGYRTFVETDVRVIRNKSTYIEAIELQPASIELESVIVTSGFAEEDAEAPVSNFTYTRDQIIRTPGATGDIFRAIEALPGVSTSGGEFSAFSVRGGTPKENIILVDNIPFSKLTHFDGGSTEEQDAQGGRFSIFAPGTVEEANFQGGAFGAPYGGKFSSLLDLQIREGNFDTPTFDGRFDVLGGELNYNGPSYLHKKTSLFVSARHQDFERILELTGQGDLGHPSFTDIFVKSTTLLGPRHKVSLLGIFAPERFRRTTEHTLESDDLKDDFLGRFDEDQTLLGLNWRWLTGSNSYWQNTFFFGDRAADGTTGIAVPIIDNQVPTTESDFIDRRIFDIKENQREAGLRSVFTWLPTTSSTLTLGLEALEKSFDYGLSQNGLDTLYVFDGGDSRATPEQKYLVRTPEETNLALDEAKFFAASFAQFSLRPQKQLTLNAGLRHEYNQFNQDHYFSPRASLEYRLDQQTRLSLASGLYYQIPEFEVLGADPRNLGLKNERSIHAIAGLTRYLSPSLKFIGEVYYKRLDDLLVRTDRTDSRLLNQGEGTASGVDLALIRRFADRFYGQINYSFSRSQRDDNDGLGTYDSDFNQPHIFSLLGGYQFNKEWSFSAKWRFASGRPTDAFAVHANVFDDPDFVRYAKEITANNADRLPAFHTLNIRIDYRKQLGRYALVSFLDIVNLYDHLNVNEQRFLPRSGRFEAEGFGILPTFGLKLEF